MTKKQKYEDLAKNIVDLIGGMDNITFFTHCITRLRINVKDKGLVKNEAILALSGVVGSGPVSSIRLSLVRMLAGLMMKFVK